MKNNMMRRALCLMAAVLVLIPAMAQAAFTADDYLITGEDAVSFAGSLGAGHENARISLIVFKNGKTIGDFLAAQTRESMLDMLVCYKQTAADAGGNYSVDFSTGVRSGCYNAYIGSEKSANYKTVRLYYVRESENRAARERLGATASASEIEEILRDEKYSLYLNDRLLEKADVAKLAEFLSASDIAADGALASFSEASVKINKAAAITAFSDGAVKVFSDYYDCFDIDPALARYLSLGFMNAGAKARLEGMLNRNPKDFAEFERDFLVSSLKSIIYSADGYGYVKELLLHYADALGIDRLKITDKVCNQLIGKLHDDVARAVSKAYETREDKTAPGDKTGVKSGGKMGSVTVPAVPATVQPTPYGDQAGDFGDLSEAEWARPAIAALAERGAVRGKEDGNFHPNDVVRREEFVKMIMEVFQFAQLLGDVGFDDVSDDDWFAPYVKNACLAGIVRGVSDTEFGSGREISRQDMAVIMDNALQKRGISLQSDGSSAEFADQDSISGYAQSAVLRLAGAKIIVGDSGRFNPLVNTTRAEAAQMIYRILPYLNEGVQ